MHAVSKKTHHHYGEVRQMVAMALCFLGSHAYGQTSILLPVDLLWIYSNTGFVWKTQSETLVYTGRHEVMEMLNGEGFYGYDLIHTYPGVPRDTFSWMGFLKMERRLGFKMHWLKVNTILKSRERFRLENERSFVLTTLCNSKSILCETV